MIHCGSRGLGHQVATGKCQEKIFYTECLVGGPLTVQGPPRYVMGVDIIDFMSKYNSE